MATAQKGKKKGKQKKGSKGKKNSGNTSFFTKFILVILALSLVATAIFFTLNNFNINKTNVKNESKVVKTETVVKKEDVKKVDKPIEKPEVKTEAKTETSAPQKQETKKENNDIKETKQKSKEMKTLSGCWLSSEQGAFITIDEYGYRIDFSNVDAGRPMTGNYFIGNNEPESAGVRVIGEGHIIKGNYFRDLVFRNDRCHFCAIHLMQGQENPAPGGYQQVKNTTVCENIIVNCSYGISACAQSKGCPMPVVGSTVERNTIVVMGGFGSVVSENAPHEIEWRDNTIYGGHQIGLRLAEVQKSPKLPKVDAAIKTIRDNAGVTSAKSR